MEGWIPALNLPSRTSSPTSGCWPQFPCFREGSPTLPFRCRLHFLQRLSPNSHLLVDSEVLSLDPGGGAGLGARLGWEPHSLTPRPSLEGQKLLHSLRKPGRLGLLSWVLRRRPKRESR